MNFFQVHKVSQEEVNNLFTNTNVVLSDKFQNLKKFIFKLFIFINGCVFTILLYPGLDCSLQNEIFHVHIQ